MKTLVGIFSSQADAARAYSDLRSLNLHGEDLIVLTPEASLQQLDAVPTEDGEQPGMGKAIGGVIGGAMGLAAGVAVASLLLPGVGTIIAIGLGAGTLGLGGAVAGAAGGGAIEELLTRGLPKDEIFLYEDALRQGRTVIIVTSEDDDLLTQSRQIMERNGAESLDAAREKWWIGLRETGVAEYDAPQEARDEPLYRSGFQAALEPDLRGKPLQDARSILKERFPLIYQEEWFQRGYARARNITRTCARKRPSKAMPLEDFDDLNVMSLTETKSQRAPTSESAPFPLSPERRKMKWLPAAMVGALAALIAVAVVYRLSVTPGDVS